MVMQHLFYAGFFRAERCNLKLKTSLKQTANDKDNFQKMLFYIDVPFYDVT